MEHIENRDFETTEDVELTEEQILDAEKLVVDYVCQNGELPKQVELEDFEVVKLCECLTKAESEALEMIISYRKLDLDFEEFYGFYVELAGLIKKHEIVGSSKALNHMFGNIQQELKEL